MSYIGPFLSNYREDMVSKVWLAEVSTTMWVRVGWWCLTAAFMSYIGPFLSNLKEDMVSKVW